MRRRRIRWGTSISVVLAFAVVVVVAVGVTTWWHSPGQRAQRLANDLRTTPGVERVDAAGSGPSRTSANTTSDRLTVRVSKAATSRQVARLIRRLGVETTSTDYDLIFYLRAGRTTTCVCDNSTSSSATVAGELLALRALTTGKAYVYDDRSVGLDPPPDASGTSSLAMARASLTLLQKQGLAMPPGLKTYDGRIALDKAVGTAGQFADVLGRSRALLEHGWRVRWLSGQRLYFMIPPEVTRPQATTAVGDVAGALGDVEEGGVPVVRRVVATSADKSVYADADVPR